MLLNNLDDYIVYDPIDASPLVMALSKLPEELQRELARLFDSACDEAYEQGHEDSYDRDWETI